MKKTIVIGGFTKSQREKELQKIKLKYEKKGYQFIEYIENGLLKSIAIFEVNDLIIRKEKSIKLIGTGILFLIFAIILYISGGSNNISVNKNLNLFNVSDFEYTMGNKDAVSINIGESNTKYINITIHKDNIKEGLVINTKEIKDKDLISITAHWDKKSYFQNNKNSFTIFKILELDKINNKAKIFLETKLYSVKNDNSININSITTIEGQAFINLIK
ncbi:hypothetical protein OZZ08_13520 [Malaciobacter mytili]|uniref:hypothetical protein n=1 Tax=Malaciobacter mytili TaxID=603050 RepID=UPI003BB03FD0